MNTKEAIEFLERLKHCELGIKIDNLDDTINILKNYKGMLGDIKKTLMPGGIVEGGYYQGKPFPKLSELDFLREWLSNLEQKYFPKPKSRWQRINDMIDGLNTIGHGTDIKELVNLLIELRDEEE